MLIDLLSTSNYLSANISLVKLIGLIPAIYLNELININSKAVKKDKINDDYFKIDRRYICDRTTISEKEQLSIDESLVSIDVMKKIDNDTILINLNTITTLIMSSDETLFKEIKCAIKPKKKTKEEAIKDNLISNISTTNEELRGAYINWIDSVFIKSGWMTKQAVISAQSTIDTYSNRDLDIALKLLEIASVNAWRDIHWAISEFEKNYKNKYLINKQAQPVQDITKLTGKVFM